MRVLLTGGFGFIGRHVVRAIAADGHCVLVLDTSERPDDTPDRVSSLRCSLDQVDWVEAARLLGGSPEVLIHLAAFGVNPAVAGWAQCFQWNVQAAVELWQAAIAQGVRRIVTCGSCFEYGASGERYDFIPTTAPLEPLGAYAASKAAATMALFGMASSEKVEGLVLRPCVVYGEGEPPTRLWPSLKRAALAGEDFPMTSGLQVRDFVPVEVVARAFAEAVTRGDLEPGKVRLENVGSGRPESVLEFATGWWHRWHATGKLLPNSIPDRPNEAMRYVPEVDSRNPQ
jgi:UDP-glucose 4-epimerase